jgi:hypothetical protein
MGHKSVLKSALVMSLAVGLLCARPAAGSGRGGFQARKGNERAAESAGPLVLKRLLESGLEEDVRVIRDIFRPLTQAPAAESGRTGPKPQSGAAEERSPRLELAYLGFVRSGERVTAIVVFQGQTLTVAADEEIVPGFRVTRLTPDEIEVSGPDAVKQVFHRQGERS